LVLLVNDDHSFAWLDYPEDVNQNFIADHHFLEKVEDLGQGKQGEIDESLFEYLHFDAQFVRMHLWVLLDIVQRFFQLIPTHTSDFLKMGMKSIHQLLLVFAGGGCSRAEEVGGRLGDRQERFESPRKYLQAAIDIAGFHLKSGKIIVICYFQLRALFPSEAGMVGSESKRFVFLKN
jgi:hypothetical protein